MRVRRHRAGLVVRRVTGDRAAPAHPVRPILRSQGRLPHTPPMTTTGRRSRLLAAALVAGAIGVALVAVPVLGQGGQAPGGAAVVPGADPSPATKPGKGPKAEKGPQAEK